MKKINFNFKSGFCEKLKLFIIPIILLTLAVEQMWGANTYILGPDGSWTQNAAHTMASSGISNWLYKDLTVTGQWNNFKVYYNSSTWYGKDSGGNNVTVGSEYSPTTSGDNAYCDFKKSGLTYYFFFNTSTKKLMIQPKYYLAGTCGASNQSWGQTQNATTYDATNGYFKWNTCSLTAATEYQFKLCTYNTWDYYNFEDWSGVTVTQGSKTSENSGNIKFTSTYAGTAVITFDPISNNMVIHCPYQISYNPGANGSGSISAGIKTWKTSFTLSSSTFTRDGYTQDGWSASDGGSKVYNLGGSYTTDADVTLYPHWVENTYTVTINNDGNGTTDPSGAQSNVGQVTGIAIEATEDDGFEFVNWTITSGTGSFMDDEDESTTFYPTSTATIQANFRSTAETTHEVTIAYKYGVTTIKASTAQDVGEVTPSSISSASITGYTFSSWSLGNGLTNESGSTTADPISITTKASGTYALTANYSINTHTVTFNAMSGSGSMSNESFNYNQTKALTTNAYTRSGYVFKGWATSSANATAGTVAYADGANYTMGDADVELFAVWYKKAYFVNVPKWTGTNVMAHVYTGGDSWKTWNTSDEKMTSTGTDVFGYTIYSYEFPDTYTTVKFHNAGANETSAWTWSSSTPYYYHGSGTQYASADAIRQAWKVYGSWNMTGGSWNSNDFASYGATTATYTVSLAASTEYKFKYVFAGTNSWYGCTGGTMSDGDTWTLDGGNDVSFTTTIAGTYTFTINYSGMSSNSAPSCTLDFPTSYTVNFDVTPAGAADAPTNNLSISDGAYVASGTSITFTKQSANTGYTWSHWEKNGVDTGESGNTYTTTINANTTVNAVYTENQYNATVSNDGHGSVSPTGTVAIKQVNGTALTATPSTNYVFKDWTISGGGIVAKSPSTTSSNPATFTATSTGGTIRANFTPKWHIVGGNTDSSNGSDEMGDWDVYANGIENLGTNASSKDTGYVNITLPAKTTFYFKVRDLSGEGADYWYGNTGEMTYLNHSGWTMTTNTANCRITTANAGTYKFAWNITDKKLTVTYPVDPTYTVTVTAGAHGTASPASVTAGEFTSSAIITGTPTTGYYFGEWTCTSGSVTFDNSASASTTVRATEASTVRANFVSQWVVGGSFNDWDMRQYGVDNFGTNASSKDTGYVEITLAANTNYTFKVYNMDDSSWWGNGDATYYINYADNNAQPWDFATGKADCGLTTAGAGNYKFAWNITDHKMAVHFPTSYAITYGKVADNGQDIGSVSATGDDGSALATGKYVAKGSATFTAADAANYHFVDWRTSGTFGEGTQLSTENPYTMTSITADKTVYAHYAENMTTVTLNHTGNGHIEIGGATVTETTAGTVTDRTITAVPDAGYYFAGWEVEGDCSVASTAGRNDNEPSSTTLNGLGAGTTGTVTANFVECEKIYFRNIFDDGEGNVSRWSDVYVYYGITWTNGKVHTNSNSSYIAHMTQIAGKDVYWAYIPRAFTYALGFGKGNVAFSDTEFTTNYDFYNATASGSKAASRGDYHRSLNMFVPNHTAKSTNVNGVDYFDNGYWMKYDTRASQGAGYYLKKFKAKNNYWQMGEFVATADDATAIRFTIRVDNTSTDSTRFMIVSAGQLNYIAEDEISATDYTKNVYENLSDITKNSIYFQINTDTEGDYTLILDQSSDVMKLTVDYPVSPGDYRLKHTYNDGSAKTTYSDVIKSNVAGSSKTLSMYLSTAGTETLVLQKCERIDNTTKQPVWSAGDATNLSGILTKVGTDGNSVYQFDITVNTTTHKVSEATNIKKYDGDFYIKTDCAAGGWINYNQNKMGHNTINFDPAVTTTFDYYFCKWVGGTKTNVKCVIANDYCNQISDTLRSDDILHRNGIWYETLPYQANVRFSYNSATNELRRSYLLGSTDATSFLVLKPQNAGYVYRSDETTDMYSSETKFEDNGNWTYQLDAYIYPGATGGVFSNYPTDAPITTQTFLPETNQLMGGTKPAVNPVLYHVRLIYDFKTNHLMAAWFPNGEQAKSIDLQADFMMIRDGQNSASQLSFATGKSVTNAHRAYGAFEFKKDQMVGHMGSWNATSYGLCMYYFSFPFDVNVSDIFGVGTMGTDWRIQRYNGAKRAEQGWFAGDGVTTFWEDVSADDVLKKYEGYSLLLNRVKFNTDGGDNNVWINIPAGGSIYLIFPSASDNLGTIASGSAYVDVPSHECTIDRYFEQDRAEYYDAEKDEWKKGARNHKMTDSHWNMVGAPVFQNLTATNIQEGAVVMQDSAALQYVYAWNSTDNSLGIRQALNTSFTFNSMFAYMVQYTGRVTFTGASINSSLAARRTHEDKLYTIDLELNKGERFAGRTYVELRENAVDTFLLNEDMYMMRSSKTADIYTYAGGYDVAANILSIGNHIIPVGLNVKSAGTFTFSMQNSFSGEVILVDNYANTQTNLAMEDYEVYLDSGECEDRFSLEINVNKVPTTIDGVEDEGSLKDGKAHKFLLNGMMYILQNGVLYDAQGRRVE